MWQLVLVCRAHALITAQWHSVSKTFSFLIIMHILALELILLFIVLESKETKRIKYVVSCVCDCAWTAPIQATDTGHTYYATCYNQHIMFNLCSVLVKALNVQLKSKFFLFSYRTKQMLNMYVRNS